MKFSGFSLNYTPLVHTDISGRVIDSESKHTLAQGWLQSFSALNSIMAGEWGSLKACSNSSNQHCSFTPLIAVISIKFDTTLSSSEINMPIPYFGILSVYNNNVLVKNISVSGSKFTLDNINFGDHLHGSLAS